MRALKSLSFLALSTSIVRLQILQKKNASEKLNADIWLKTKMSLNKTFNHSWIYGQISLWCLNKEKNLLLSIYFNQMASLFSTYYYCIHEAHYQVFLYSLTKSYSVQCLNQYLLVLSPLNNRHTYITYELTDRSWAILSMVWGRVSMVFCT